MSELCAEKIGLNAVNHIENAIRNCALLKPEIEKRGNTPSWDGFIYVYQTKEQLKKGVRRAPVQVKGTYKRYFSSPSVTEYVSVIDLDNYLNEGGAIYFYVYMTETEHSIYYASLLPYDIIKLLEQKNAKRVQLSLQMFPKGNSDEITNILISFLIDKEKQRDTQNRKIFTLSELKNSGLNVENLVFQVPNIGINNANFADYLMKHPPYIYAEIKGLNILLPVDKPENLGISQKMNGTISINDVIYYDFYIIKSWNGKSSIVFGKSFSFNLPIQDGVTFNAHLQGNIEERITDIKFLLALADSMEFKIKNQTFTFQTLDISDTEIERLRGLLSRFESIKQTFEELHITKELDLDKLTGRDQNNLDLLIKATLFHESIILKNTNNQSIITGFFNIANITILITGFLQEGSENRYFVNSFTKPTQIKISYPDAPEETEVIGSQYLLLSKEHFARAMNLDWNVIYDSLTGYGKENITLDHVNLTMLEILKAFDENNNPDLLELAHRLSNWITDNRSVDSKATEIDKFNQLQIIKRKRNLTPEELADLHVIKRTSDDPSYLCAACILLDESDEAKGHFLKLLVELQKEFIEYPICKFWRIRDELRKDLSVDMQ